MLGQERRTANTIMSACSEEERGEMKAYREAYSSDKIPRSDVPAQNTRSGNIPFRLCFDGE